MRSLARCSAVLLLATVMSLPDGAGAASAPVVCGGIAPDATACTASLVSTSSGLGLSAGAAGVFAGTVEVLAWSATGTKGFTCAVGSAGVASHTHCTLNLHRGRFEPGQVVSVTGRASGSGGWRVTARSW